MKRQMTDRQTNRETYRLTDSQTYTILEVYANVSITHASAF